MTTTVLHPNAECLIRKSFIYRVESQQALPGVSH